MTTDRREFLKGVALSAGAGVAAGCACAKGTCGCAGAPMRNFRCAPMKSGIRVGVVGCGARGSGAVTRLLMVPGVTVTAVCDIRGEYAEKAAKAVVGRTGRRPLVFSGSDIHLEGADEWPTTTGHHAFDEAKTKEIREKYMHPLFRQMGEIAKKVGGHGGMDFLMDVRWAYCLQNGLPLDTDVYDLASWCAVSELSERSARDRSRSVDFPDFTRGVWKTACNGNLMDASLDLTKIEFKSVGRASGQLSV